MLPIPPPANGDDRLLLREVGRQVTDIILGADGKPGEARDNEIRRRLAGLAAQPQSAWAAPVDVLDGTA